MPWKVSGVVERRRQFVQEWETENWTMTELCARHGISRQAGYNTVKRYEQGSWEGLAEQSRAPRRHPNQTPEKIEQQIVELRHEHMSWGPRKLKAVRKREHPGEELAGGQYDRRVVTGRRAGGAAQEAAAGRSLHAPVCRSRHAQPRLVRRFPGLEAHARWDAHRSADHHGCLFALSAALSGGGEDGHAAGASDFRSSVPGIRADRKRSAPTTERPLPGAPSPGCRSWRSGG